MRTNALLADALKPSARAVTAARSARKSGPGAIA
jgi:hypothetical protein